MIRPREGQVLVRVLPREVSSTFEVPQRFISPEEQQELNHHPKPPPAIKVQVLAIGPWKRLPGGLALLPPFPAGANAWIRPGSGVDLSYEVNQKWKLVKCDDLLAFEQSAPDS